MAQLFGNRAFFRQKRDGENEYIEGESETIEYDGRADVFKLIKDFFPHQKETTREQIKGKYLLVKQHDRVGRMADTLEYSNVAFPRHRFEDELVAELRRAYFAKRPGLIPWHKRLNRDAMLTGVISAPLGHRREFFPDPNQHFPWVREAKSLPYIKATGDTVRGVLESHLPSSLTAPSIW